MNRPKLTDPQRLAIRQLRGSPGLKALLDHAREELAYVHHALTKQNEPPEIYRLQGRAAELSDLIENLTKE